jgi:serine/threonine-protein kinase
MQAGQRIRDYVLGEKIGQGGMGEVWSAVHEVLQRPVAIKGMVSQVAADPKLRERFLQEARAQARLQHPRIIGVTDAFQVDGVDYLVMPLVQGRSLADRLAEARGPLPPAEALRIAVDVLDALEAAHQRGIIHRDVKPSNILLDQEGRAYLTDFGIALLVGQDRLTQTGITLGTPFYMSPEQIRSPLTIDQRSDVYSASCVIYEMLAGRPPFTGTEGKGNTDFVILESHLQRRPEPIRTWNPLVPAALDEAILRGLAKEPHQRYGGCGELRQALDAAMAAPKLPPPPPQPQAPPSLYTQPVPPQVPSLPMPVAPTPAPPAMPRVPPPIPVAQMPPAPLPGYTPAAAPRRSRGGFFLGIACGVILAIAGLASLGNWLSKKQAEGPPAGDGTTTVSSTTAAEPEPTAPANGVAARFVRVWTEHNVQQDGRAGMLLHAHFIIEGARQQKCQLTAYFHYATGEVLKDFDQDYRTDDGQVSVWEDFTPEYDSTEFEDFKMFMPYDELHMEAGHHQLKFDLQLHHQPSGTVAAESEYVPFELDQQ